MAEEFLKVLWHEYCAVDGFCLKLRIECEWDKTAFESLTEAMRLCCKHYEVVSAQQAKEFYERGIQYSQGLLLRETQENDAEVDLFNPPLPETKRMLPDWLAEMFWDLSSCVTTWTAHSPGRRHREHEPEYLEKAHQRLNELASWFFTGDCPWLDEEKGWVSTSTK